MRLPGIARLSRRLRLLLLALLTLATLGSALDVFLQFTVLAAPAPAFTPARAIPLTDVNPYGASFFLEREVEIWKRERTVQMARAAGITWARQQFPWAEIEPERGTFDWSKYDDIVALYRRYGIQVIARLDTPPLWARANPSGTGSSGPPDNFDDYGAFVEAFARHYKGQIYYFQIWNEPNLAREWNDGPVDPTAYVRLLKIAYARAKAVDPNIRILTAPLAPTFNEPYPKGERVYRNMDDVLFLDEMYQAGAKDWFDILSANAFGQNSPPEDPPDPGKLNFQRVVLERQVMEKYDDADKSVWIDEYGWNAPPESIPDDRLIWGRVTEEQQADYTVRGIQYARKNWPWVGVISIWFFRQVGDIPQNSPEYYFRMVDVDFTPRPVYVRLKEATSATPVAGPGEYEETDPALQYSGQWNPNFDPQASAGAEMISKDPEATISVHFWGEELDLVAHTSPTGGRFVVTLDGHNAGGLPRTAGGHSYVELAAAKEAWQSVIPVARDLGRGEHVLELAAVGNVNVDGFIIPEVVNSDPPWALIAPLTVVGLLGGIVFFREWRR
jgi:polysaccharide biosynthesis protein PslG